MIEKESGRFEFEGDWKEEFKKLKLRPKTPFKFDNISMTYKFDYVLKGDAKMSLRQRKILDKMNAAKAGVMKTKCVKEIQKRIIDLEPQVDAIRKKKWIKEHIEEELDRLVEKEMPKIAKMIDSTTDEFGPMIDKNLAQFVKGKHHKKKKFKQILKHSIKVPLALAAIPIAFLASAIPFIAPVSLIALKGAILSLKNAIDYGVRHHKGISDLGRRIQKNIAILQPRADEYADLAAKAEQGDKVAIESLKLMKAKIKKAELVGCAFNQFLDVHKKTISNLEGLIDKYRRKLNKHKYLTIHLGRKIDKLEDEVVKIKKKFDADEDAIKEYPKVLASMHIKSKDIDKYIAQMEKKNKKRQDLIKELEDNIAFMEGTIDESVNVFVAMEVEFENWVAKVKAFKDQRPKSVKKWKKAIKGAAFVEGLAEAGLSFGSNFSTAGGLVALSDTAATSLAVQGTLADLGTTIQDNNGDIAKIAKGK